MHSDCLLVFSHCNNLVVKGYDTAYTINQYADDKKWDDPTTYLGADITKFQIPDTG